MIVSYWCSGSERSTSTTRAFTIHWRRHGSRADDFLRARTRTAARGLLAPLINRDGVNNSGRPHSPTDLASFRRADTPCALLASSWFKYVDNGNYWIISSSRYIHSAHASFVIGCDKPDKLISYAVRNRMSYVQ